VRLSFVTALGWICALVIPPRLGIPAIWGTAGLTASAGVSGWIEFSLLRRSMSRRIGDTGVSAARMTRLWLAAALAAAAAYGVKLLAPTSTGTLAHTVSPGWIPLIRGALVLPVFGGIFLLLTFAFGVPIAALRRR